MNIAVIFYKSQYDVLRHFARYYMEEFRQLGHTVYPWDIREDHAVWPHGQEDIDVVFAMNGQTCFYLEDQHIIHSVCDAIPGKNKVIVWHIVDHPVYHIPRLQEKLPNRLVFYVDEGFPSFVTDVLHCATAADGFLPHAGVRYQTNGARPRRDIDVLFTSTAFDKPARQLDPDTFLLFAASAEQYPQFMKSPFPDNNSLIAYFNDVVDFLLAAPAHTSLWDGVSGAGRYDPESWSVNFTMFFVIFVDKYLRAYKKHALLDFALQNDLRVHVYGTGWEKHRLADRLEGKQQVDFMDIARLNARSKVVLNSNGNHAHGSHERVFNALINGAIPLVDGSSYYERTIPGLFLTVKDTDKLHKLLTDENYFNNLSEQASGLARRRHTWAERARQVIRCVNDYRRLL